MAVRLENISASPQAQPQRLEQAQPIRLTNIQPQEPDSQEVDTEALFSQLGGRLPASSRAIALQATGKIPQNINIPIPNLAVMGEQRKQEEIARRDAFAGLIKGGSTIPQLDLSLKIENLLKKKEGVRVGKFIGGTAGGLLAGQLIPGPVDELLLLKAATAALGAGVGGAGGEAIQTGLEEKRLIDRRETLSAFATEAAFEGGGRVARLLLSPFIKSIVPEAAALVDDFAKVGGTFSPTELDSRFSLRVGEAFARGGFGTEKIFQEFEEKQGKAVVAFARNIIDSIGEGVARQTPEEIGETFARGITRPDGRIFNIFDELIDPLYKQVDELAKGSTAGFRQIDLSGRLIRGRGGKFVRAKQLQRISITPKVSTKSLKNFARKHLATDKRLNSQFLSLIGRSKLQNIINLSDELSFSDMRTLRSSFLRDARKLARDVDQSQGIIKQLAGITDNAIFDPKAAVNLNPEALKLLRNTNALYKTGQEGLKTTFSETLAKRLLKNPSNIAKEAFPKKNPKAIRLLRKSLVEPLSGIKSPEGTQLWNQMRQVWLADAVEEATKTGVANPRVFDKILRDMGDAAFKEMFPEKAIAKNVRSIQTLLRTAGKPPPRGVSLFARGAQVGGAKLIYDGGRTGGLLRITAGASLSFGPVAFARLATTPGGVKFLTAGLKLKPGSSGIVPFAARAVKILTDLDNKERKQRIRLLKRQEVELRARKAAAARKATKQTIPAGQLRGIEGRPLRGITGRPLIRQL